jgi:phage-related protein
MLCSVYGRRPAGIGCSYPTPERWGGGLHEMRIAHPEGPFRVIYSYLPGRRIVLLHAFVKRTDAIRQSDLDAARTRKPTE